MIQIAIFGLGEAGSLIARDLATAGSAVHAFDPAEVPVPAGVTRHGRPADAVRGAQLILGITAAADARTALEQALAEIPADAVYADLSTSSAELQRELGSIAEKRGLEFTDVALMATVPGRGLRTPALAAGPGAARLVSMLGPLGMPVQTIGGQPGDASARKLLRSVMMKGLAAIVIEAMRGGHAAGCAEWLWRNLADEITSADEGLLSRLVLGSGPHAARRAHEMEASRDQLEALGVEPLMTRATIESLRRIPAQGLPRIPGHD